MALGLEDKKYVEVIKDDVTYNVIGVNVVKGGVTYNVWGSESPVVYVVDTNVAYSEDVLNGDSVLSPKTFTPTKNGYTFVGWRKDKTASSSVLTSAVMEGDPITLYAVFSKDITLTYYNATSKAATTTGKQYYNNGNINNPKFTVEQLASPSWDSRGWGTNSKANAAVVYESISEREFSADTTVYALYQRTITLSYNGNGAASGSVASQTGIRYWNSAGNYSNPSFTLASNGFTRSGYSFTGWDLGGVIYAAGATVTMTVSTVLYAQWFDMEITVFTASFTENAGNLVFEESGRSMDGNYLSNVMSMLKNGAGYNETNEVNATLLALTDKAKSEYNYVTVTFRAMHYCIYGGSTGTVAGETLYKVSDRGEHFATYTKKLAVTNTNWAVNMKDNNKSDYYGCDNRLAVQSIVLSVS